MFTFMGILPVPAFVYAWVVVGFAALPNAIFGIVPNAVVADIAEADGIETGNYKAGMFFGIRSFEINVGVSVANILFPSQLTLGMTIEHPYGIRMSAIVAAGICILGIAALFAYNEKAVLLSLAKKETLTGGSAREVGLEAGGKDPPRCSYRCKQLEAARSRYQEALVFHSRAWDVKSVRKSPNRMESPWFHSKLSSRLQWK
jgi:MFS family permease